MRLSFVLGSVISGALLATSLFFCEAIADTHSKRNCQRTLDNYDRRAESWSDPDPADIDETNEQNRYLESLEGNSPAARGAREWDALREANRDLESLPDSDLAQSKPEGWDVLTPAEIDGLNEEKRYLDSLEGNSPAARTNREWDRQNQANQHLRRRPRP
jgi:hypothetical protein